MPLVLGTDVILRLSKGSKLTHEELDANFEKLVEFVNGLEQVGAQVYDPEYPAVRLNSINVGVVWGAAFAFGSGTAFSFNHHTPLRFYGQGHASAPANLGRVLNIQGGGARILFWGKIVANVPIAIYYQRNGAGAYVPISAEDPDTNPAFSSGMREENTIEGLAKTDFVDFYVAPCDGSGDIASPVTAYYALDIAALNWR